MNHTSHRQYTVVGASIALLNVVGLVVVVVLNVVGAGVVVVLLDMVGAGAVVRDW